MTCNFCLKCLHLTTRKPWVHCNHVNIKSWNNVSMLVGWLVGQSWDHMCCTKIIPNNASVLYISGFGCKLQLGENERNLWLHEAGHTVWMQIELLPVQFWMSLARFMEMILFHSNFSTCSRVWAQKPFSFFCFFVLCVCVHAHARACMCVWVFFGFFCEACIDFV